MPNSITLRDVAKLAEVSIGTASQALNNRPNVAPETRARVIDAAKTLGYAVKSSTVESRESPLEVVGLLTKHDFGLPPYVNPFYSYIQAGVVNECRRCGISLMYANVEVDPSNRPVVWPKMIDKQRIDGLLLVGTFIEDTIDMVNRKVNIPIVLVDSYAPRLPFDSIVIDNILGARMAIEHLVSQGHRHIGLIGSNTQSPPGVWERREGYLAALQACDIDNVYIEDSTLSRESGYEATLRLLQRTPEITAIFACNDPAATGAIHAARELDRSVPGDLSVIGFDDIDLAKNISPSLTTIHVYKTWLGTLGIRQLIERARRPNQPKISVVVSTQLVVRDSVCPLAG